MTTKIIKVSPLPVGTTQEDVKNAFNGYRLDRIVVVNHDAFLQFTDINDVETLDFTFDSLKVPALGGAEIDPIFQQFKWPETSSIKNVEQKKEEPPPPKKQSEPTFILESKSTFIVVRECDAEQLKHCNQQFIRKQIFGKYKIGRVLRWQKEVYIEFLDSNEVQILQNHFKDLFVLELGPVAKIDAVEENFNAKLIENNIKQHQEKKSKKKEEQDRKREQDVQKKKQQMEQIRRAREREEQLKKMKEIEQKKLIQMRKKAEQNHQKEAIQDKIEENNKRGKQQWTVRPDLVEQGKSVVEGPSLRIVWLTAIIVWGIYLIST